MRKFSYKQILSGTSHTGRGYRTALRDALVIALATASVVGGVHVWDRLEDVSARYARPDVLYDAFMPDAVVDHTDAELAAMGYAYNAVDPQTMALSSQARRCTQRKDRLGVRVRTGVIWSNPGGRPTRIQDTQSDDAYRLALYVLKCRLHAADPEKVLTRVRTRDYDYRATLDARRMVSQDGSHYFRTRFSMTSGTDTYMEQVKLPETTRVSLTEPEVRRIERLTGAEAAGIDLSDLTKAPRYGVQVYEFVRRDGSTGYAGVWSVCGNIGGLHPTNPSARPDPLHTEDPTPVSSPGTLALFAAGLLGLGWAKRRFYA